MEVFTKKLTQLRPEVIAVMVVAIVYLFLSQNFFGAVSPPSRYPYYNLLVDAFFHGRLNLLSIETRDLSLFQGKWYLYYGPAPALFILPFYLLAGLRTSDNLYTVLAGIGNVILFSLVVKEFITYFKLHISSFVYCALILSFAFASPNFYLSISGNVWSTSQIVGTLYLQIFLLLFLKYLNERGTNLTYLFFCVVFFNLAWLSRYTYVIYLLLFLLLFSRRHTDKVRIKTSLAIILSISALFIGSFLGYNYARFHSPFETGLKYHNPDMRYVTVVREGKLFSVDYFWHNTTYMFLNHLAPSLDKTFIRPDTEGNSIFSVYPFTLLFIFLFQKKYWDSLKKRLFLGISCVIICLSLVTVLLYLSSGWQQLGSRYFLDVTPLVFLLVVFPLQSIPKSVTLSLLVYGSIVNFFGLITFISYFRK